MGFDLFEIDFEVEIVFVLVPEVVPDLMIRVWKDYQQRKLEN
jgi:hypothetical protein